VTSTESVVFESHRTLVSEPTIKEKTMSTTIEQQQQEQMARAGLPTADIDVDLLRVDGHHASPAVSKHSPLPPTGDSACARVFASPELLTLILASLSPLPTLTRDGSGPHEAEDPRSVTVQSRANGLWALLHAQRISHACRDLVSTRLLQRRLFLMPQTTSSASWAFSETSTQPILNPVVQTITHWRFSHLSPGQMGGSFSAHMIIERADYANLRALPISLNNMLLSQPPTTDVTAFTWERLTEPEGGGARSPRSGSVCIRRIRDEGGVIIGQVLEIVGRMFLDDSILKAVKVRTT